LKRLELRHLRYFVKSAELLHFTRAAEALHVSQPTLSTQIQELEKDLGAALFHRVGRAVQLTPAGTLFLSSARRALSQLEAAQQCLDEFKGLLRGTLRIGATAPFGAELLPRIVTEFLRQYPGMQIVLTKAATHAIEEGLKSGLFDLGLVYHSGRSSEDFDFREVLEVNIVVVVSRKHALSKSKLLRLDDLAGIPLALPTADFATRQVVNAAFAAGKIRPKVILETNDVQALFEVVRGGVAATLLPDSVAAHVSGVARIHLAEQRLLQTAAYIWLRGGRLTPAAKRFLELAEHVPGAAAAKKAPRRSVL
jgi:LysR family transcriptional regulator, cyn operon transcriptional activator